MLKPLSQWYCDVCDKIIEKPEDGYVIWMNDENYRDYNFKIIHQSKCDNHEFPSSMDINSFLGEEGRNMLLSFLSIGPIKHNIGQRGGMRIKNMDEFVDFFRRMQVPYYEEARKRFHNSNLLDDFSDANEIYSYQVKVLKKIIEKYTED